MVDSTNTTPQPETPPWLTALAQRREPLGYGLFALAFLWALVPAILLYKYREEYPWVAWESVLLMLPPLVCIGVGIWQLIRLPEQLGDVDATRLVVLIVGGAMGLDLVLMSFMLGYHWWEVVSGGMKVWIANRGQLLSLVCIQFGGLALLFVCLQLVRGQERSNALLRRLLYGYNAGLTGLLLLEILAVINVLGAVFLPAADDWTTKSIYALSSRSENIVQGLDKPTNVYVIMPRRNDLHQYLYSSIHALLENCQALNDRIHVEYLNPDQDVEAVKRLAEQYELGDRAGVLVVYGTTPNTQREFIKLEAFIKGSEFGPPSEKRAFKGESELMTVFNSLEENKQKAVVYFTQGEGELDLSGPSSRDPEQGMDALKRRLEADRVTIKGLRLSLAAEEPGKDPNVVTASEVPKDAAVVVIAGPKQRFAEQALKALREYMEPAGTDQPKGKLFALLGVVADPQGKMLHTGVEDLLADFNVKLGENRLLIAERRDPYTIVGRINSARDFLSRTHFESFLRVFFPFSEVRTVDSEPGKQPGSSRYQAEPFFFPVFGPLWVESNLTKDPMVLLSDYLKTPERTNELRKKLTQTALPIAVAVSEPGAQAPQGLGQPGGAETPRVVVFGTSTFAANQNMSDQRSGQDYSLFYSIVSWLRGRSSAIGIEPRKSDVYSPDETGVSKSRMILLPAALLGIGILGMGTGIWVVRRR
jgi:hypothetical protein